MKISNSIVKKWTSPGSGVVRSNPPRDGPASPDTFAPSYSSLASADAGLVAARAEELKEAKYALLVPHHILTPVAIETGGV